MSEQYIKRGGLLWIDNEHWRADREEVDRLRAVLYQARSTADNYGASAGIDVIEDYLEEAGDD